MEYAREFVKLCQRVEAMGYHCVIGNHPAKLRGAWELIAKLTAATSDRLAIVHWNDGVNYHILDVIMHRITAALLQNEVRW